MLCFGTRRLHLNCLEISNPLSLCYGFPFACRKQLTWFSQGVPVCIATGHVKPKPPSSKPQGMPRGPCCATCVCKRMLRALCCGLQDTYTSLHHHPSRRPLQWANQTRSPACAQTTSSECLTEWRGRTVASMKSCSYGLLCLHVVTANRAFNAPRPILKVACGTLDLPCTACSRQQRALPWLLQRATDACCAASARLV